MKELREVYTFYRDLLQRKKYWDLCIWILLLPVVLLCAYFYPRGDC